MLNEIVQVQDYFMKKQNVEQPEQIRFHEIIGTHVIAIDGVDTEVNISPEGSIKIRGTLDRIKRLREQYPTKQELTVDNLMKEMYEELKRENWGLIHPEDFAPDGECYDDLKLVFKNILNKFK